MDQVKIGAFIALRRKERKMTQVQLAEKLGVTDRAVSKWETGRSLPDVSLMPELCELIGVTVNDLLNGEVVSMNNYNEKSERIILEMAKEKEQADKRLLRLEIVVGFIASVYLFAMVFIASFLDMPDWVRIVLICTGIPMFVVGVAFAIRIEQVAGYYECGKCGHRYVPTYRSVLFAMHFNRTRYMKCPQCGKKSWQRKVIGKE